LSLHTTLAADAYMKAGQLLREGPKIECREVYEIWISTSYDQNKYRTKVKSINI
jgi:hypothetical protein